MGVAINSGPAIGTPRIDLLEAFHNRVGVLRLDAVHPVVSGNKWYKLQGHLALRAGREKVVTFGGAYSNHIVATAAACAALGIRAIGIIRGERPAQLSPTLADATGYGMELHFISRADYREKKLPPDFNHHPDGYLLIPEGGYGAAGATGIEAMATQLPLAYYTHILCCVGTGTTLAGLLNAALPHQRVLGISSQKNNFQLEPATRVLLQDRQTPVRILHDYHFGGYAKYNELLLAFMNDWYRRTGIPSDRVYTGKMFFAFDQLWHQGFFPPDSTVLLVHSGGLQGNRSLPAHALAF